MFNKYFYTEPLKLSFDYSYNLNAMKEIKAKDSFLTLDRKIIECEDYETYDDCTTKNYMNKLKKNCKCLPFQLRLTNEVVDCNI